MQVEARLVACLQPSALLQPCCRAARSTGLHAVLPAAELARCKNGMIMTTVQQRYSCSSMLATNCFELHTMLPNRPADMVACIHAEDPISPWQACTAGWGSNQVVGGLLLQTTRHTVVRSCQQRFSKFVTQCTYQQAVYDAATGQQLVQVDVVDALVPYGVDAVFLPTSSEYNAALAVGEFADVNSTLRACQQLENTLQGLLQQAGMAAAL